MPSVPCTAEYKRQITSVKVPTTQHTAKILVNIALEDRVMRTVCRGAFTSKMVSEQLGRAGFQQIISFPESISYHKNLRFDKDVSLKWMQIFLSFCDKIGIEASLLHWLIR